MVNKQYIAYYRVSTKKQGKSGLGLEAQRQSVIKFISPDSNLVEEYTDIESGKNNTRVNLLKALSECKRTGATLLIAKLDRLSRNASFTIMLRDSNINFICVDMPDVNNLTIGILAIMAQDEVERISKRIKEALGVIKKKLDNGEEHISKDGNVITKLGSSNTIPDSVRYKGLVVRKNNAKNNPESRKAGAFIVSLRNEGKSFYSIIEILNSSGFKAPRGGEFTQIQAKRLYDRYVNN